MLDKDWDGVIIKYIVILIGSCFGMLVWMLLDIWKVHIDTIFSIAIVCGASAFISTGFSFYHFKRSIKN